MAAERLHGDDTTVPVLAPGKGRTETGRLWVVVRDEGSVIGKQHGAPANVRADGLVKGIDQGRHAADPIRHRGAVQLNAGAFIDHALPVQGQRIGVFRDDHMRKQTSPRTAALNRKRRQWRLHDRRAGAAAQLRPHVLNHLEERRHVFQHLGDILANLAQHRAAA